MFGDRSHRRRTVFGFLVAGLGVAAFFVGMAVAESTPTKLCVPELAAKPVKTPTSTGECPGGKLKYHLTELGREGPRGPAGAAVAVRARNTGPVEVAGSNVPVPVSPSSWTQGASEDVFSFLGSVTVSTPSQPNSCELYVVVLANGQPVAQTEISLNAGTSQERTRGLSFEYTEHRLLATGAPRTDTLEVLANNRGCAIPVTVTSVAVDAIGAQ